MPTWAESALGALRLPSGRVVRGRGLRRPLPTGPQPDFAVYLLGRTPPPVTWESRWLPWRDFWLPSSAKQAHALLAEAWHRSADERVELACGGGRDPSPGGARAAQADARRVLARAGAHVVATEIAVARAYERFDGDGRLTDADLQLELTKTLAALTAEVRTSR